MAMRDLLLTVVSFFFLPFPVSRRFSRFFFFRPRIIRRRVPLMARSFCVYILASRSRTLYTGITNNVERRLTEHREGKVPGFTTQYRTHRLVHFEQYDDPARAIAREKEIKGWRREKKVALIERTNPTWDDLSLHHSHPKK
jgi:putative endonuclease